MHSSARLAVFLLAALAATALAAPKRDWDVTRAVLGIDAATDFSDHEAHPRRLLFATGHIDSREAIDIHGAREADGVLTRAWHGLSPRQVLRYDDTQATTYIVQFRGKVTPAARAAVESVLGGAVFGPYVPHNALLLHCTHATAAAASSHPDVAFVGMYHGDLKLSRELAAFLNTEPSARVRSRGNTKSIRSAHIHGSRLYLLLSPAESGRTDSTVATLAETLTAQLADAGFPAVGVSVGSVDKLVAASDDGSDIPDGAVSLLSASPSVFYIELAPVFVLANKYARWLTQSGVDSARPVYTAGLRGQGQIVGCADSGLDWDNCLFASDSTSSVQPGPNHRKVLAYEVLPGNDATDDVDGHGTHVVGSIVGNATGASSAATVSQWNGMAEEAKVYFQDIGKTGGGLNVPADINTDLFPKPYAAGARIHSDSWGSSTPTYDSSAAEVDRFMAGHADFLVLIAAGNDGASAKQITSTIGAPATSKNCLAVGASQTTNAGFVESVSYVDWSERQKEATDAGISDCCTASAAAQKYCCQSAVSAAYKADVANHREVNVAPFSSRGPTADGRIKPELMAPGEYIMSSHSNGAGGNSYHCGTQSPSGANDAALLSMAGTSMATPVMAGTAALVRQYFLDGWYPTGVKGGSASVTPSGALVKAVLINSGVPLTGSIDVGNNGTLVALGDIPSVFQGFGRVQLDRTLKLSGSSQSLYVDDGATVSSGEKKNYCFTATGPQPLKATVVWTDPAGVVSSELALVNDLNLFMGTDSNTITGNWGNKHDTRNTVEQNSVTSIVSGTVYKVQIHGRNVPQGPQAYALVVTGAFAATVEKDCAYTFTDNFGDATDKENFPLGVVVGVAAAGVGVGVIGIIAAALCRNNPGMQGLIKAILGGGGGR